MLIHPHDTSFGTFFDLLNGYRIYELLQVIRQSRIMEIITFDGCDSERVIDALDWDRNGSRRFIDVLCELGFLQRYENFLCLSPFSRKFLHSDSTHSQLRTLEFEPRLRDNWTRLYDALQQGSRTPSAEKSSEEKQTHLELFLDAMDEAALSRAEELWNVCSVAEAGTIMEVGAGSGAYLSSFLRRHPGWKGIFCDVPAVVELAKEDETIAPLLGRMSFVACDMLSADLCSDALPTDAADILLLSNLIHCQDAEATGLLLRRSVPSLKETGVTLIHDFLTDACWQGALYDLHMLVNTYSGRTYRKAEVASMLKSLGLIHTSYCELSSYSSVIAAAINSQSLPDLDVLTPLKQKASSLGFTQSIVIDVASVPVANWVREKCKTGCSQFQACASCPPNSLTPSEMKELLSEFSTAILIVGEPPLKVYQEGIVELEKFAFLNGYTKALAFGGGPCSICKECHPSDCKFPEKRRFSLESCGVDVFGLMKHHGITLRPLTEKTDYIQYVGMLLVE